MFQWKVKYSRTHDKHKLNFVGVKKKLKVDTTK